MYTTQTAYDGMIEDELHTTALEVLNLFFDKWAEEGYTTSTSGIDETTEEEIELSAEQFFTAEDLTAMEKFLDEPGRTRADIARFYFKGDEA